MNGYLKLMVYTLHVLNTVCRAYVRGSCVFVKLAVLWTLTLLHNHSQVHGNKCLERENISG